MRMRPSLHYVAFAAGDRFAGKTEITVQDGKNVSVYVSAPREKTSPAYAYSVQRGNWNLVEESEASAIYNDYFTIHVDGRKVVEYQENPEGV